MRSPNFLMLSSSLRVIHTWSATDSTPPCTMVSFTPCWMAAMAAGSATSPYGMSEASALRIVVPPPAEVMKPLTSSPASDLNQPFSRATANGTPYMPVPKWVTVRSTAKADAAPRTPAANAAARRNPDMFVSRFCAVIANGSAGAARARREGKL